MNDSAIGNHFTGNPATYGVNREDMIYFLKGINDTVMKELPGMPRTVASNCDDKSLYRDFALDLMGSNRYATDASFGSTEIQLTYADMILTEYNVEGHATDLTDDQYTERLITFREGFMEKGYAGGFQWCWIPSATDAAYYLLNKRPVSQTDFKSTVTDLRHFIDDYRAKH